jgi:hypothetical protein
MFNTLRQSHCDLFARVAYEHLQAIFQQDIFYFKKRQDHVFSVHSFLHRQIIFTRDPYKCTRTFYQRAPTFGHESFHKNRSCISSIVFSVRCSEDIVAFGNENVAISGCPPSDELLNERVEELDSSNSTNFLLVMAQRHSGLCKILNQLLAIENVGI